MKAANQLDDTELRTELAGLLGWYRIRRSAKGILTGNLPGVRSVIPLAIPKWTTCCIQVRGVEESIEDEGLTANYVNHLLTFCPDVEATPRQRCEAALITLRGTVRQHTSL